MDTSLLSVSMNPFALLIPALLIGVVIYILIRDWLKTHSPRTQ